MTRMSIRQQPLTGLLSPVMVLSTARWRCAKVPARGDGALLLPTTRRPPAPWLPKPVWRSALCHHHGNGVEKLPVGGVMASIIAASGCGKRTTLLPRRTAQRRHPMEGIMHGHKAANCHAGLVVEGCSLGRRGAGGGTVDTEGSPYPAALHAFPLRGLLGRGLGSDPGLWMRPAPRGGGLRRWGRVWQLGWLREVSPLLAPSN